jgi:hypothetical protein
MKGVLVLKTLRQIHFAKKIFRGLNSKDDEEDVDDEDSLGSIGLSEFFLDDDNDDSDTGDYSDDQGEIEDDSEYNGSMSHCTSVDTDYGSCVDDEDSDFYIHIPPHVQRTAFIVPTCE